MQIRQTSTRSILLSGLVIASLITLTLMFSIISSDLYGGEQRRSNFLSLSSELISNTYEQTRVLASFSQADLEADPGAVLTLRDEQRTLMTALGSLVQGVDQDAVRSDVSAAMAALADGVEASEEELSAFASIRERSDALEAIRETARAAGESGNLAEAVRQIESDTYAEAEIGLLRAVDDLMAAVDERTEREAAALEAKKDKVFKNYAFLLFIILVATFFEYLWGAAKIVAPIEELTRIAGGMADGNYKRRANIQTSNEVGVLASTFNDMADSIEKDIAERKRTAEELEALRFEAESANSAKSDFLATMSHEIRTPMNAIIGMGHLALQTDLSNKQRDYVSKIFSAANSLLGIINDILDFSKMEAGKIELEKVPFRLDEVLDNLSNITSIKAREKGLEFLISISPDVPLGLVGDSLRLGQVLINLTNNALKFTDQGEILLRVEAISRVDETVTLRFSLQDTGIGMSNEQQSRLFQAFSQADTSTTRKYGGTGLGLTISKRLVELMEGEIWVESEIGVGSNFQFLAKFPTYELERRDVLVLPDELKGNRVLVIDDSPDSRMILHDMFVALGLSCDEVRSGREGLERLIGAAEKEEPFNLVLVDWRMPEMDGLETIRQLQQKSNLAPFPKIIMVTAYGRQEVITEANGMGFSGILLKPVTPSLLFDAVMNAFGYSAQITGNRSEPTTDPAQKAAKVIGGAKVLLVEDNIVNQQVATELLEYSHLIVKVADNGAKAIAMLEKESFDCCLMDLQMPVMGGLEATRRIRAMDGFENLPIIAMTANVMGGDREATQNAGMNGFVGKPIDPSTLYEALVQWIPPGERSVPQELLDRMSVEDTPAGLPPLEGIDVAGALNRVRGNSASLVRLFNRFVESEEDAIQRMRAALEEGDREAAVRAAHTLKGVSGNIGAVNVQEAAARLEKFLKENENGTPEPLFAETEQALTSAIAEVTKAAAFAASPPETAQETATESDIQALLDKMTTQIEEFDATASDTGEILMSMSADQPWADDAAKLAHALRGYDFDKAEELLSEIRTKAKETKA